jgi:hypothetical protein
MKTPPLIVPKALSKVRSTSGVPGGLVGMISSPNMLFSVQSIDTLLKQLAKLYTAFGETGKQKVATS